MLEWNKYDADFVRTAKNSDGQRLALLFSKDFYSKFGQEVCLSCISKFRLDFKKYISAMEEKKEVKFKLKPKYNGIVIGHGKGRLINEKMNEKDALFLLKNHPKGEELFEIYPQHEDKKTNESEIDAPTKKTRKAKK